MSIVSRIKNTLTEWRNKPTTRIVLGVLVLVQAFLISGIGFGWGSMSIFLEKEGVYSAECTVSKLMHSILSTTPSTESRACEDQAADIQLLFTIGLFFYAIFSLPTGYIIDKWGCAITMLIGNITIIIGMVLYAIGPTNRRFFYFNFSLIFFLNFFISSNCIY